jgi:hypothetical protein
MREMNRCHGALSTGLVAEQHLDAAGHPHALRTSGPVGNVAKLRMVIHRRQNFVGKRMNPGVPAACPGILKVEVRTPLWRL